MKSVKALLLSLLFLTLISNSWAQESNTFQKNNDEIIKDHLKELYGEYYDEYGEPNISFYTEYYQRCEFISLSEAPVGVTNISSLSIKDKYNPEKIYHENNMETFDQAGFNLFKYSIDRYAEKDLYFRVYTTDIVLKVNGLK